MTKQYIDYGFLLVEADEGKLLCNGEYAAEKVYFFNTDKLDADWYEINGIEDMVSDDKVINDFIDDILSSVVVDPKPEGNKEGFVLQRRYDANTNHIVWEYVEDTNYVPQNDGTDFLRAISYTEGMEVTEGLWYTDGEYVWEAIATGIPTGFDDVNYFDIIA